MVESAFVAGSTAQDGSTSATPGPFLRDSIRQAVPSITSLAVDCVSSLRKNFIDEVFNLINCSVIRTSDLLGWLTWCTVWFTAIRGSNMISPATAIDEDQISDQVEENRREETDADLFHPMDVSIYCLEPIEKLKERCRDLGLTGNFDIVQRKTRSRKKKKDKPADEELYEVDEIVDYKITDGVYFLVKWKGWDISANTWEPIENLTECDEVLNEFKEKNHLNKIYTDPVAKLAELRRLLLKVTSESYSDPTVLLKFCNVPLGEFHGRKCEFSNMRKTIKEKTELLGRVSKDTISQDQIPPTTVLNYICRQLNIYKHFNSLDELLDFVEKREEVRSRLETWEKELNEKITRESNDALIAVENFIDLEGPPQNFTYITSNKVDSSVIFIDEDPPIWCECSNCYDNRAKCCPNTMDAKFAYARNGALRLPPGHGIFECNTKCKCSADCPNRVVQNGRRFKLSIFRTDYGCGWGVKAIESIPKGRFVMEYVGEVITVEEADRRGKKYEAEERIYIFDLDFTEDKDSTHAIDAAYYGDISHFVNHSCDPNLEVHGVWINNYDLRLPRIAFFSKRCIKQGEQLTFDYKMTSPHRHHETADVKMNMISKQKGTVQESLPKVIVESLDDLSSLVPLEKLITPAKSCDNVEKIPFCDPLLTNGDAFDYDQENRAGKNNIVMESGIHTPTTIIQEPLSIVVESYSNQTSSSTSSNPCSGESSDSIAPKPSVHYNAKRILCKCGSANCRKYLL